MKKAKLLALSILSFLLCSGTYGIDDMNAYMGRWGYIKVDPPLSSTDGRTTQEIPTDPINIDIKLDAQTVQFYGNGQAFVQPTYSAAQKWNAATINVPNVTHVQLNVGIYNVGTTYDGRPDDVNSILFDVKEKYISKNDLSIAGLTVYTKKQYTLNSICEGKARQILETDIYLHAYTPKTFNWKVLNGTQTDQQLNAVATRFKELPKPGDVQFMPDGSIAFKTVERNPMFDGDLNKWFAENMHYPEAAKERGEHGQGLIQFTVGADGSIINPHVAKSTGYAELDAETLRVVRKMPNWPPVCSRAARYQLSAHFLSIFIRMVR